MAVSDPATEWWRTGVVYQVYIRSFADGNGDGEGDLAGLRARLGYLAELGVDAIWVNPWYSSPMNDGGYDVSDYRDINERFGDLDEARLFIAEAHEHGIRVIADLVPNHTSNEHEWFQEALAAEPGSAARDRYIFKKGKGKGGKLPPTDWESVFGGKAWSRLPDGDWYLHLFDDTQPDLNWEHPEVRAEFEDIFRFWLDLGVDGFRVDVAHGMVKDQSFPDQEGRAMMAASNLPPEQHPHWDQPGIHEIVREWRKILDSYDGERMMVAEAWVHPERVPLYLRPDEYHQLFDFHLLGAHWEAKHFEKLISGAVKAANKVGASSTWVLSNHDVMRHASRYALPDDVEWRTWPMTGPFDVIDPELGRTRARAAALITLSLPGSTYVYQGDELGLPEVYDLPEDVLDDPMWERSDHTERGRDGCRIPIPWTRDGVSFGFGDAEPWLPQPEHFGEMSAEAQEVDPDSMLSLYREAIAVRAEYLVADQSMKMRKLGKGVLAYERGELLVVANMGLSAVKAPPGDVLIASSPIANGKIPANATAWIRPS